MRAHLLERECGPFVLEWAIEHSHQVVLSGDEREAFGKDEPVYEADMADHVVDGEGDYRMAGISESYAFNIDRARDFAAGPHLSGNSRQSTSS